MILAKAHLSVPVLPHEFCMVVAAAHFGNGGWKKLSVRGQGSEGKEKEAKGDERKEKAGWHSIIES